MNTNQQRGLSWLSDLSNNYQPTSNSSIQTSNFNSSSSLKTSIPSNTNNSFGTQHNFQNTNTSDFINNGSNNNSFGEDFDDTKSTVSNESNSSRFSSISGHSSTTRGKDNLQKLLMTNRYSDSTQLTSIDSSALSWDEMQNVLKTGSAEKEIEQMKDKIEHLQKNNLTLSQSLYSTNKDHLLLMNTLKEKIHEVFPNILIENQKLKDQVKDLTNYVMNLEKQIEKLRCENEHSKLILENKITELRKEIEGLKTKTPTKNDRIDELINASIKPIEQTLRNNNITIKRCMDDSYQLGQFKLNVNLEKRGDTEIVQVLLKDKTVAFDDFLKTFCNKFVMK